MGHMLMFATTSLTRVTTSSSSLTVLTCILASIMVMATIGMMYRARERLEYHDEERPRRGHDRSDDLRIGGKSPPPNWNPEDKSYPLRQWTRDIQLWLLATDYPPHAIAALLTRALKGSAAHISRGYTCGELTRGRLDRDNRLIDPVTMILNDVSRRYMPNQLEEEMRADYEFSQFHREQGEPFESALARYHAAAYKQREQGLQDITWRNHAITVLRFSGLDRKT